MGATSVRRHAITAVQAHRPPATSFAAAEAPGEVFGKNIFTKAVMQKRLPKPVYRSVLATIEH
jgi:glutamine synthetase